MAHIFAVASGNFNNSAIWSSGSVPTSADDVFANGFTVTLNSNSTVNSLRNTRSEVYAVAIATPIMTSYNTPSGTVIHSGDQTNLNAWLAFDQSTFNGTNTGFWRSSTLNSAWLGYQFSTGRTIVSYSFYTGPGTSRIPRDWTFQASNDGTTWTTLHTVTAATLSNVTWYRYSFTNTVSYTYYRMNITAVSVTGNSIEIIELQMTESSSTAVGSTLGGSFVLSDGVTFTSTNGIVAGNTTPVVSYAGTTSATLTSPLDLVNIASSILVNHTGTGTLTINGNITGSQNWSVSPIAGARVTSSGTITLNGSIGPFTSPTTGITSVYGIEVTGTNTTLNINGNITGQNYTSATTTSSTIVFNGLRLTGINTTVNVTGNVTGGASAGTSTTGPTATSSFGIFGSSANITVSGNVTGGSSVRSSSSSNAIYTTSGGSITVNGDVTGGLKDGLQADTVSTAIRTSGSVNITGTVSSNTAVAVLQESNSNVTITGNVTSNNAIAISSAATTATNNIAGNVTAVNFPGVYASSTSQNIITGYLTNGTSGAMAFWGQKLFLSTSGSRTWTFNTPSAATKILYTADLLSPAGSQPAVTDVRSGTVYALGTLTGTCVIPPKNSVTAGVPVDNTVGTALLTLSTLQTYAQAAWNIQTSAITTSGSIGERLKEASTVAITGQQIAGFDI